jgi:hypothetical protein
MLHAVRETYLFDEHLPDLGLVRYFQVFARLEMGDGDGVYYVVAGAHSGVRVLAEFSEGALVGIALWKLHPPTLRMPRSEEVDKILSFLRRAADQCQPTDLALIQEVGGFHQGADGYWYHRDGWFTESVIALPIPPPAWAPDAQAWDFREGIYLTFPDGSYRLVRRWEYYDFKRQAACAPIARQGDCLFYTCSFGNYSTRVEDGAVLGRHKVSVRDGQMEVSHPQHGTMTLPAEAAYMVLEPGTSSPFQRGYDD